MMYQIDHVRAYWLHLAMQIPGGASNPHLQAEYWRRIHHHDVTERLSR